MRDIPVFTTEYGVASLVLRQIPYRKEAYIRIQDTAFPKEFLEECETFCKMAGAEIILATGHDWLSRYPLHTAVWRMTRPTVGLPETDTMTMPVTEETLEKWREIYNNAMADVPNASYMDTKEAQQMLQHRGDARLPRRLDRALGADPQHELAVFVAGQLPQFVLTNAEVGCGFLHSKIAFLPDRDFIFQ